MTLVGFVLVVCSLLVLFDIVAGILKAYNVVDFSKNEGLKKAVDFVGKMTAPVYGKVSESLPEKYRKLGGVEVAPLLVFIVLAIIGQLMM
ncbi:MAG: YggT family protein [Alphaproteobacteria bacterium]|nr:YggT family protein [Alphaproteobacteria bacterium]